MTFCINYTSCFYYWLTTFTTHAHFNMHHSWDVWFPWLCSGLRWSIPVHPTLLLFVNIHSDIYFLLQRQFQKTNIWNMSLQWGWCHHILLQNHLPKLKGKCLFAQLFQRTSWGRRNNCRYKRSSFSKSVAKIRRKLKGQNQNERRRKCCTCEHFLTCCSQLLWKHFCLDKLTSCCRDVYRWRCICLREVTVFILSDLNRRWNMPTNVSRTPEYKISWKSVQRFSSCYMRTDRHGPPKGNLCKFPFRTRWRALIWDIRTFKCTR
jgi:hypothetical protein